MYTYTRQQDVYAGAALLGDEALRGGDGYVCMYIYIYIYIDIIYIYIEREREREREIDRRWCCSPWR